MCKSCAGQICEHNSQWWQIKAGSCCKRRPVVVGAGAGRIYKCLQEVSNLRLQRPSQKMECKECCMSAILTLLLLLHLSIQTGGKLNNSFSPAYSSISYSPEVIFNDDLLELVYETRSMENQLQKVKLWLQYRADAKTPMWQYNYLGN